MVRFKQEGYRPKRSIKLALTCGEETPNVFNGVSYLIENHRDLIDAGFALNEGGGGRYDQKTGVYRYVAVLASEKVYQDFTLTDHEPGRALLAPDARQCDLSARARARQDRGAPVQGRVQRHLARLLREVRRDRGRRERRGHDRGGEDGDAAAIERLKKDPSSNAILRTNCVATQIAGGHAPNALPQRATANVNCRMFPGHSAGGDPAGTDRGHRRPEVSASNSSRRRKSPARRRRCRAK